MNRYILAVSGGIDSVVLLDMFDWPKDTIVAHYNHGIRPSADDDCVFVEKLAHRYGFRFVSERAALGAQCSEELARRRRYDFLRRLALEHNAEIVTAHHADDCIESIIINCLRGTGWRGLAPFGNQEIFRPMQMLTKSDIYRYAAQHRLRFRLDQTNNDEHYLRNRIRQTASKQLSTAQKEQLLNLYRRQVDLKVEIENLLLQLVGKGKIVPRELLDQTQAPENIELLRFFLRRNGCTVTLPQAERCLREIKKYSNGKKYSIDKTHFLVAGKHNYRIQ